MSTIKKRVMLQKHAVKVGNRDVPGNINLRYEDVENFSYKEIDGVLTEARFFQEDLNNYLYEDDKKRKLIIFINSHIKLLKKIHQLKQRML